MSRLWKLWQTHFLTTEWLASVLVGLGFWQIQERVWGRPVLIAFLDGNHQALYSTLATVSATLMGFVLAALTVILSYSTLPKFAELSKNDGWGTIFRTYFQASFFLFVETLLGFLGLVYDTDQSPRVTITYLVIGVAVFCAFRFARCVWILTMMTAIVTRPDPPKPEPPQYRFRSPHDVEDSQVLIQTH